MQRPLVLVVFLVVVFLVVVFFFFCLVAGVLFVLFGLVWFLCCASASLHAFVPSLTSA